MGLAQLARPFLQPRKADWQVARKLIPEVHPSVVQERLADGSLVLSCPVAMRKGFWGRIARSVDQDVRKSFELEAVGAFVWSKIDGRRSLESLSSALQKEFKMPRLEAEVALMSFVQLLADRGLIMIRVPKK